MNVMTVFDVVIAVFGIYMVVAGLKMKKTGEISGALITPEEVAACKDRDGFVGFIYWKEAIFGGIIILVGILGVINEQVVSLGRFNLIEMLAFFGAFLWFQHELRVAREKFLRKF